MSLRPGGRFGPYRLHRRLARGGMGEIWLAERTGISGFSKRVVLKTILEAYADQRELVDMFLHEGRIAAELTHANIAQVFDLGCLEGTYYMVMELVDGRDLRDILVRNVEAGTLVPLDLVLRIVADVCQGLHHAHSRRTADGRPAAIVHRDISPQNILVSFDGEVKIVDFGVAKALHLASRTKSGVLKGKYAYMSPEQIKGREIDGRSDLFSTGVVMYELVTGRRLFKRDSEIATLEAVIRAEVPAPSRFGKGIPRQVEAVIMRALQADPLQRYGSAREMQQDIERVMIQTDLLASSHHLAAYLEELFGGEREPGPVGAGRLAGRLDEIPSVWQRAKAPERTIPFARRSPEAAASREAEATAAEPTRNLLPSNSGRRSRSSRALWPVAVAAVLVAIVAAWAVQRWLRREPRPAAVQQQHERSTLTSEDAGGSNRKPADVAAEVPRLTATPVPAGNGAERPRSGTQPAEAPALADRHPASVPAERPAVRKTMTSTARRPQRSSLARLTVTSLPPGKIYIDGKPAGQSRVTRRLRAGRHRIRVLLPEGGSTSHVLTLAPREHRQVALKLQQGSLQVVVIPYAYVWVNGRRVGETPMPPLRLYQGSYQVRLHNDKLERDEVVSVKIEPGRLHKLVRDWR